MICNVLQRGVWIQLSLHRQLQVLYHANDVPDNSQHSSDVACKRFEATNGCPRSKKVDFTCIWCYRSPDGAGLLSLHTLKNNA